MNLKQLNGFAFDTDTKTIGAIAGVDFIKKTISILTDADEIVVASLKTTVFLEEVGAIGGVGVINHDVVSTNDGKLYEIELLEDGKTVQLHLINAQLERIDTGDSFPKEEIGELAPYVTVMGNIHELEPEAKIDFNIRIVREQTVEGIEYFYACNNADAEEIDLIKVVFVGHQLLEEEKYARITLEHDLYLALVEEGSLVEVSPQQLQNYVTGLLYGKNESVEEEVYPEDLEEEEDFEEEGCDCYDCRVERGEEDEIDEDYCDDCGEAVEDCDCW